LKDNPELCKILNTRISSGRPPLEEEQPRLLKTIIDIAMHGSASRDKRQNDMYRSVKTSDQLKEQLKSNGFVISRSGLYLRLQPRCNSSQEGKRHVKTVPVKLIRAQNDDHAKHVDGEFFTATITHLEELSSILGPKEVCFISQDDKCRVPSGMFKGRRARHLPRAPPFWGPPLRCYVRKFSLIFMKNLLFTHIMY